MTNKISLTSSQFTFITSLIFLLVFNAPFLQATYLAASETENTSLLFILALPSLLLALLHLLTSLWVWPLVAKPITALLLITSCFVVYAQVSYGVVFDYGMIQNIFETDASEATSYLSLSAVLILTCLVLVSSLWLMKIKITYRPLLQEILSKGAANAVSLGVAAVLTLSCYAEFAATARNNPELKRQLIPFEWVDNTFDYWRDQLSYDNKTFLTLDAHPTLALHQSGLPRLTIIIVGETARADHFAYNGYQRDTNRYTRPFGPLYFQDMISCGTATAVSVPCIFSDLSRQQFSANEARQRQNLLDLAQDAGVHVTWIDNNSSCKGTCLRQSYERIATDADPSQCDGDYCFDSILLNRLQAHLADLDEHDSLIVLHQVGSHGPTYFRRYPAEHRKFTPDCPRSDIQNCDQAALINTYDNTILYSDYINAKVMELTSQFTNRAVSVMYVSDHGESLGDSGVYLHGLPYSFAPAEQTHVPMWLWTNHHQNELRECLAAYQESEVSSHDNIFYTLMHLLGVHSAVNNPDLNMLEHCDSLS